MYWRVLFNIHFLLWGDDMNEIDKNIIVEHTSSKKITIKTIYIDITGNLNAGILLSKIVDFNIDRTALIKRDNKLWLAKNRNDWKEEAYLTEYQYDTAIKILKKMGVVQTKIFKLRGAPLTHTHLNKETLLDLIQQERELV